MPEAVRDRLASFEPEHETVTEFEGGLPIWTLRMARIIEHLLFERDRTPQFYVLGLDTAPREVLGRPPLPRSVLRVVAFDAEDDLRELKRRRFVAYDESPEEQW